jgi:hypothetical protein
VTSDAFTPREIPPDRLDLGSSLADTNEAKILFDPSVRYRLIEEYGFKSFTETEDGRLLQGISLRRRYILPRGAGCLRADPRCDRSAARV